MIKSRSPWSLIDVFVYFSLGDLSVIYWISDMPVINSAILMHVADFFLRNFLFCIRLQPINNVEIVSGE